MNPLTLRVCDIFGLPSNLPDDRFVEVSQPLIGTDLFAHRAAEHQTSASLHQQYGRPGPGETDFSGQGARAASSKFVSQMSAARQNDQNEGKNRISR